MTTDRRLKQMRVASRRYYYRTQLVFRAAGLNARGQKPGRRAWTELGALRGDERRRERERRVRAAHLAAGLNWRGRARQLQRRTELGDLQGQQRHNKLCQLLRQERRISAVERAWRNLRESMGDITINEPNCTSMSNRHDFT